MFDGMLILRSPSTSLVEKMHLEKMHAILNPMTNRYKKNPSLYGRISSTSTILFLVLPQPPVADGC